MARAEREAMFNTRKSQTAFGLVASLVIAPWPASAKLPACPTEEGVVGDWRWVASWAGPELSPRKLAVLADGDIRGGQVLVYGRPGRWTLSLRVVRPFTNVRLIGSNDTAALEWTVAAKLMPPSTMSPTHYWWLPDLTPIFESKAGLRQGARTMTLEIREGERLITKIAIELSGFREAVAKSQAANKPIAEAYAAKRCIPGGYPDDEP